MTEVPEDQVRDLERGADEMEEGLDKLQHGIDTAQERAAEARERANPDAVAGDWEDEATGAQQGDDAVDAEDRDGARADAEHNRDDDAGGGSAIADAPVHEAEKVEPGGASGEGPSGSSGEDSSGSAEGSSEGGDDDGPSGSVRLDDVPVHEAEQVEPEGSSGGAE